MSESTVELWYRTWHQIPKLQQEQDYSEWLTRFRDDLAVQGDIWIAEIQNCIVGFIVLIVREQELNQLFIDPNYQNQGIGSALMNKAKEICLQGLKLTVLQQNITACRFYEKHGFTAGELSINKVNGLPCIEYSWFPDNGFHL